MSLMSKYMGLAMMGLFLSGSFSSDRGQLSAPTPEEIEELTKMRELKRKAMLSHRGVQEWEIDGFIVYARDRKNAERKVRNAIKDLETNN